MRSKIKKTWRTRLFFVFVGLICLVELLLIPSIIFEDGYHAYNDLMKAITAPFGFLFIWFFAVCMFTSYQNGPRYFVSINDGIVKVKAWDWLVSLKTEEYDLSLYKSVIIYSQQEERVPNFLYFKSWAYPLGYFDETIRYCGLVYKNSDDVDYLFTDEFMDDFMDLAEYLAQEYDGKIEFV